MGSQNDTVISNRTGILADDMNSLWAITSYFNPMHYARRLRAYRTFRDALNIPLLTVELGYRDHFDLADHDADIMVKVPGHDVMWQKECLLNIAIDVLPVDCTAVAWLDCDILFERQDWPEKLRFELKHFPLVQLFQHVHYLGPDWKAGEILNDAVERSRPSLASGVTPESPAEECLAHPSKDQRPGTFANGFAWGAGRELLNRHRFFDACIIGGGDRAMSCAAYGCYEHLSEWHDFNPSQQSYYQRWARPFHESCQGRVSALQGDIYHQWHGKAIDRGLGSRHAGLSKFHFDPYHDIERDEHGCWRWSSNKPEMHSYVEQYFISRREDG